MLQRSFFVLGLVFSLVIGCGEDAECVIDTDCELGFYCGEQTCRMIGDGVDSGVEDAGDEEDAATPDAGVEDAGEADAQDDAGEEDAAPEDGGDVTCLASGDVLLNPDMVGCQELSMEAAPCTLAAGVTTSLTCAGVLGTDCTLDEDCACSGTVSVGVEEAPFTLDLAARTFTLESAGLTCTYDITPVE